MGRDVTAIEELFSRLVYMLSLTLVNLDKNPAGEVAKHYLVKRLIVLPGEQMRMRDGRVEVKAAADNAWLPEEDLKHQYLPLNYTLEKKFYPYDKYDLIKRNIIGQTYLQAGVVPEPLPAGIDAAYAKAVFFPVAQVNTLSLTDMSDDTFQINYFRYFLSSYGFPVYKENWDAGKCRTEYQKLMLKYFGARDLNLSQLADADVADHYMKLILAYNRVSPARINAMSKTEIEAAFKTAAIKYIYTGVPSTDEYFEDYWHYRARWSVAPYESGARHLYERRAMGWYIPTDRFFPMGDNRDNSRDARWFGAVKMSSLLGKTLFRFWPLNRLGPIN
jgi:signal peptidase I